MTDSEMVEWLNHWLVSFTWNSGARRCVLEFQDMFGHLYTMDGADLRDCVKRAAERHPDSGSIPIAIAHSSNKARI